MTGSISSYELMDDLLVLRGVEAEFPRLMKFAETFASRHGLPACERARLLIILEELFTNAIRYGYPEGATHRSIKLALAAPPGRIEIEFSDDGGPFNPLAYELPESDRPFAERGGGEGLRIVRSLVDEARYRREGERNHLALVRKLKGPG
jgi:serine/threonine-protein kinase RsbW